MGRLGLRKRASQAFGLSLAGQLRSWLDPRVRGKLLVGRGAVLQVSRGAQILVERGSLYLNAKWGSRDPGRTFVHMMESSKIVVKNNFAIYSGSSISLKPSASLVLGGGYANSGLRLDCYDSIRIGANVAIAENVSIRDSDNKSQIPGEIAVHRPVDIGDNVWIGMNATILKGVRIGKGAIIAAGSVVVHDVPENSMVAGVPARVVRTGVQWE